MNHWQRAVGVALLAALSCAAGLWAQSTGGGIVGRVADEEGGGLPGVTVEAKSPALQGVRTTTTAADGSYRINVSEQGQCTLTLPSYEGRPSAAVFSGPNPAAYNYELVKLSDGKYELKRR